jgi:hypothetical protein
MPQDATVNAKRLKDAMDTHNSRLLPSLRSEAAMGRLLLTIKRRSVEVLAADRFAGYAELAAHFGQRMARRVEGLELPDHHVGA